MIALRLSALPLLLATAPLAAQANRFVPANAQVVARIASPAKWKADFSDTLLADAIGGEGFAQVRAQIGWMLDGLLERLRSTGEIDAELVEKLLTDWRGDIVLSLSVDLEDLVADLDEGTLPSMALTISLTADDDYPLGELADAIGALVDEEVPGDQLRDFEYEGRTLRCIESPNGTNVLPTMIDGQLVTVLATDPETDIPLALSPDDRRNETGENKAFYLHIDAQGLSRVILDATEKEMESNPPPFDPIQVLTDLGLSSLRSLDTSVYNEGEHAIIETNFRCDAETAGLLGALLFDHDIPRLLRYVPAGSDSFHCMPLDFGELMNTVERVWEGLGEAAPISFSDVEDMFAQATKVRLREDLLDHLGSEVLFVSDPEAALEQDEEDIDSLLAGTCCAIALRDGHAFGESLETVLRSRGLHAARKTETYGDVPVYSLPLAGMVQLEYAITDDLLLIAPGSPEFSGRQLRAVLDARNDADAGLPESVTRHLDGIDDGWNEIAVSPLAQLLVDSADMLHQVQRETGGMPPAMQMATGLMDALGKEFKRVGLDQLVSFGWVSPGSFRQVIRL